MPEATSSADRQPPVDWSTIIDQLALSGAPKLLASNCGFLRRAGDVIHLSLDRRSESLLTRERQQKLAAALGDALGETLRVEIEIGAADVETPLQAEARIADERLAAARESLEADPNVRTLKDMFGATLNADSIEIVNHEASRDESAERTRNREH